jgi:hypothetical protein
VQRCDLVFFDILFVFALNMRASLSAMHGLDVTSKKHVVLQSAVYPHAAGQDLNAVIIERFNGTVHSFRHAVCRANLELLTNTALQEILDVLSQPDVFVKAYVGMVDAVLLQNKSVSLVCIANQAACTGRVIKLEISNIRACALVLVRPLKPVFGCYGTTLLSMCSTIFMVLVYLFI